MGADSAAATIVGHYRFSFEETGVVEKLEATTGFEPVNKGFAVRCRCLYPIFYCTMSARFVSKTGMIRRCHIVW